MMLSCECQNPGVKPFRNVGCIVECSLRLAMSRNFDAILKYSIVSICSCDGIIGSDFLAGCHQLDDIDYNMFEEKHREHSYSNETP